MPDTEVFDYIALGRALLDWPVAHWPVGAAASPLLGRLHQILDQAQSLGRPGSAPDLMVLIRQLLIERSVDGHVESLSVPRGHGWPEAEAWRQFGCTVTQTAERLIIEARPWRPDWLGSLSDDGVDVFLAEHQSHPVRRDARVPMDPFLREATGFEDYVCPGQREALLSALCMPAGSTLIVNLPTGGGKSLVAQAPILLNGPEAGLTLFVVPTNALALDLERRTKELLAKGRGADVQGPLAWTGDRHPTVRAGIKQRVHTGTQGILFASPESVCGALLPSLYKTAERGGLRYLVVDEAHLIAQWGDDFRPAFQHLAGVRRGLLNACPQNKAFRTLLLSATFPGPVIETLETLFGPSEHVQMVAAVHLRPEPRYLSRRVRDRDEKRDRLLELLRHVPRPFILYTTTRDDARQWFQELRASGYGRLACFHGETGGTERERIIDEWVCDRLDGVVATSAFGVGMDKADVRTVIHSALPETLDRFYQEVGRGGRDGRASLSITLFDQMDQGIARGMTSPTLIGDGKGYARWRTMYDASDPEPGDPDLRQVDLTRLPGGLTQQSDYNRDWNMRTLILMARAGLIRLESLRPQFAEAPTGGDNAGEHASRDADWENYFARIPIRVLEGGVMDQGLFQQRLGAERLRGVKAAGHAFARMLDALDGRKEMATVLTSLYTNDTPGRTVLVSPVCRGCPSSRGADHTDRTDYQIPPGIGIERVERWDDTEWRSYFPGLTSRFAVVLCPSSSEPTVEVMNALEAAVALFGIREVAAPETTWKRESALLKLHRKAPSRLLIRRDLEEAPASPSTLPLPRATLLLPWHRQSLPDALFLLERPLHLVFVWEAIADGNHPLRQWRDTHTNHITLADFLRMVTQ